MIDQSELTNASKSFDRSRNNEISGNDRREATRKKDKVAGNHHTN